MEVAEGKREEIDLIRSTPNTRVRNCPDRPRGGEERRDGWDPGRRKLIYAGLTIKLEQNGRQTEGEILH